MFDNKKATICSTGRWVIAKVEFHPGELFPRLGYIVTRRRDATRRDTTMNVGDLVVLLTN